MTKSLYTDCYYTSEDGLKLYYRDYNMAGKDAPTVLCMPGLTRNSKDFAGIASHLASYCRVICAEQRGRGLSEWDPNSDNYRPDVYVGDMITLIQNLGVSSVTAIGTSLGGLMTMMIAAMHPGVLKGAVLNDIGPEIDPKGIERILSYVGKGTPPTTWEEAVAAVKWANSVVYPEFTDDEWLDFTKLLYKDENGVPVLQYDPALRKAFEGSTARQEADLWPVYDMLAPIPLLIIRGAISDILSPEIMAKMADRHPDCSTLTVPDKGHVPSMAEPECTQAIDALIKKCA